MNDCLIKFDNVGRLHGFLDILSRDLYKKSVIKDLQVLFFEITESQYQFLYRLAIGFGAQVEAWESDLK